MATDSGSDCAGAICFVRQQASDCQRGFDFDEGASCASLGYTDCGDVFSLGGCGDAAAPTEAPLSSDASVEPLLLADGGVCAPRIEAPQLSTIAPAGLRLDFRATGCLGDPLPTLTLGDSVVALNDDTGVPFGEGPAGEPTPSLQANSNIELYSVLALDLSDSVFASTQKRNAVLNGAVAYIDEMANADVQAQYFAIVGIGAPDAVELVTDFTDSDNARTAVLDLEALGPQGAADLYQGFTLAHSTASRAATLAGDATETFVVLVTDGPHEAGNTETARSEALSAKGGSPATSYVVAIAGNYDACNLEELAGTASSASCRSQEACTSDTESECTDFAGDTEVSAVSGALVSVARAAKARTSLHYSLGICTPVAMGESSVTLQLTYQGATASTTQSYSGDDLNGTLSDCDPDALVE